MTQHEYRVILETNYLNRKPTRVEFLLQGRTIDFKETLSWKIYREITNYFPKNIQTLIDKTTPLTSSEGLDFVLNIEPNTLIIRFPVTNPSDSLPELVLLLKENKQKPQFIVDLTIMEQIRIYDTHAQYETELSTLIKPNVSFCIDLNHLHFNDPFNGHTYVDLGLPSGTLWATCNVGANNPTDYGLYFAWGETTGYTASQVGTDKNFTYQDYELSNGGTSSTSPKLIKYCSNLRGSSYRGDSFLGDAYKVLEESDDGVHEYWGGDWSTPLYDLYQELFDNTTYTWVEDYNGSGISGGLFTALNGNTLFFPGAGLYFDGNKSSAVGGYYWTNFYSGNNVSSAYGAIISNNTNINKNLPRRNGCSLRGVIKQKLILSINGLSNYNNVFKYLGTMEQNVTIVLPKTVEGTLKIKAMVCVYTDTMLHSIEDELTSNNGIVWTGNLSKVLKTSSEGTYTELYLIINNENTLKCFITYN